MNDNNLYQVFSDFMRLMDLYPHQIPEYSDHFVDRFGNVYDRCGSILKPYHYENQYDSVYLRCETYHKKIDVHRLVAMTFNSSYFDGCVVHHIDENRYNNNAYNLEVMEKSEHARHHADPTSLIRYTQTHGSSMKGKKMSKESRERCRLAAIQRHESGVYENTTFGKIFHGNQYVDADKNPI